MENRKTKLHGKVEDVMMVAARSVFESKVMTICNPLSLKIAPRRVGGLGATVLGLITKEVFALL